MEFISELDIHYAVLGFHRPGGAVVSGDCTMMPESAVVHRCPGGAQRPKAQVLRDPPETHRSGIFQQGTSLGRR